MNGRVVGGRYELATVLGQGGMGQVWTAYDRRLDRRVAVKLLRPDRLAEAADASELRRRFLRECRVTAQVDHPGLVTVYDAGDDGDELYLVMRYVEGADLADHLAEHDPYPWPWAVAVAAQLCAVLAAVHAVPIVHRDLKPRNVVIRADGTLTVLDLGVAAVLDADATRLTQTGLPVGSPVYMAPEQAMGGAVGPAADLYALGVVLHELLSGNAPFHGSTALGVLHRHLHEPPVPLRRIRPEVPEPLEALVLRLLAKDPQDRPADAQAVHQALVPLLPAAPGAAAHSPGARPPGPMDPTRPFLRPHAPWPERSAAAPDPRGAALFAPGGGAGGALAGGTTGGGAPGGTTGNGFARPGAARPEPASAAEAPAHPYGGPATPAPYPSSATPVPHASAVSGSPFSSGAAFSGTSSGIDIAGAVEEVKALLAAGRITQAVDILGGALPAAVERHGPHSPVVRMLRKQYAATLMEDGQYRKALPELRLLSDEYAQANGPADRECLRFRYEAAQCLEQLGDTASALSEYRVLLPYFESYAAADPDLPLEVRHRIGHLLLSAGERWAAHDVLSRLLVDADRRYGPHHPFPAEVRRTLVWLGQLPV